MYFKTVEKEKRRTEMMTTTYEEPEAIYNPAVPIKVQHLILAV